MRLTDESAVVREAFPAEYVDVAVFVTDLGGTTVPMFVLALAFWLTRRRETALVISYAVAGLALIVGLKAIIGLPRPPEDALLLTLEGGVDENGFPSGHAFAAVVVYGGLLAAFDLLWNRAAVGAVALLVVLVSLSRVVLGVHYLGDVIVGGALGVVFLVAMSRLTDGDPRLGFAIAVTLAIPAVVVTGATDDALLGLGGAIGGVVGSLRIADLPALRSRLEGAILAAVGCGYVVTVVAVESVVAAFTPALVVTYAALFAGILLVPDAIGRLQVGLLEGSAKA